MYYGESVVSRVAGPFAITESVVNADSVLPTHSHRSPYFTFTLKGSYRERYGRSERNCTPGTAVAHPANEWHSERFSGEPALLIRLECPFGIELPVTMQSAAVMRAAWQLHAELQQNDPYSDLILEGLARELAGYAMRGDAMMIGSPSRARKAEALLRATLHANEPAHLLAQQLGVSSATFFRDFRTAFGCSPGEYQRRLRIAAAMDALRTTAKPIAQIAAECGFCDQSHLNRSFRRAVGLSPAEFRRNTQ
jgi:AraC family transcriptional regulator